MPTVQPSRAAWATIWSIVWIALGRRIFGIASISSTVSNSFMPYGMLRSLSSLSSVAAVAGQSCVVVVIGTSCPS